MTKAVRWAVGLFAAAAVAGLLAWAFVEGRRELALERERERPVQAPARISRGTEGETLVVLDAETQARIGLRTEPLSGASRQRELTAYGAVADPAPLLALEAELASAQAAVVASKAESLRLEALYGEDQGTSRKAMEAARAQSTADETRVELARRRIVTTWGEPLFEPTPEALRQLTERLTKRQSALVRVDLPAGKKVPARPTSARIEPLGEDRTLTTRLVFDAPTVDPRAQGRGFLLRVDAPGLPPGAAVTARLVLPGKARQGVVVPRSAVVRFSGKAWVYLRIAPDRFARREIALDEPTESGWFTSSGFVPGEPVVVVGPQALLSEELKSQIHVLGEEESG